MTYFGGTGAFDESRRKCYTCLIKNLCGGLLMKYRSVLTAFSRVLCVAAALQSAYAGGSGGAGEEVVLADDLRDGLRLWLDANVNAFDGEVRSSAYRGSVTNTLSGVVEWRDVRETGTAKGEFCYPRAVVYEPKDLYNFGDFGSVPPARYADEAKYPGLKMLDFGDFGSGCWMYIADADGNLVNQRVRSFFMVVGFHETLGHLLGHVSKLNSISTNAKFFFHKHTGSDGGGTLAKENSQTSNWRRGETRLNGVLIDPVKTFPKFNGEMQLISQIGPAFADIGDGMCVPYFNNFLNYGNLTSTRDYTPSRQGGAIFGEILIYERMLSDSERRRVEAYLKSKWFGSPGNAGETEKITPPEAVPVGGKKLTVGFGSAELSDIADAGKFVIEGSGGGESAVLRPGSVGDLTIEVKNAGLILSPARTVAANAWSGINLLKCGDFEVGLSASANTDLAQLASDWSVSGPVYAAKYLKNSTWYGYETKYDFGVSHCAIQGNGGNIGQISQRFTAPVTGVYKLSYYMSRRTSRVEGDGELALKVLLDGKAVFLDPFEKVDGAWDNELKYREHMLPPLEAGREYKLEITLDDNSTTDRAAVLDEIRLEPVEERADIIYVPNPGFEYSSFIPTTTAANGRFAGFASMRGTLWTTNGLGEAGFTRNSTWWSYTDGNPSEAAADRHKVYLKKQAAITAKVKIPRAGRIRFSVRYSNRRRELPYQDAAYRGVSRTTGNKLTVSLGGSTLAEIPVDPSERQIRWSSVHDYAGPVGEVELTLANTLPEGVDGDIAVIVDDVELRYEPEAEVLPRGEVKTFSVNVPEAGYWRLVLPLGGAAPAIDNLELSMNWFEEHSAAATVKVDGVTVGGYAGESAGVRAIEYDLPYLAAGRHTVEIASVAASTAAKAVLSVAAPKLVRLEDESGAGFELEEAQIRLYGESILDLRYGGTVKVGKVFKEGERIGTAVSAASCPEWVSGTGALTFTRPGFLLFLR